MTIAIAVAVALAALVFTLAVQPKHVPEPIPISPTQHLEDRKQAIYENLRDLQFEYRTGKLSDEDYQLTKLALQRELAGVLAEMDETNRRLGLTAPRGIAKPSPPAARPVTSQTCPQCGATFAHVLKFCGECGKAMA